MEDSKRWTEVTNAAKVEEKERGRRQNESKRWKAPERDRLKCNIGLSWSKAGGSVGAGWIVRDYDGKTLFHSRRAFNGVSSMMEAKRLSLIWAVESMKSHKVDRVTFELEASELVGSINRPKAWPAYRAYGEELREMLNTIKEWKVDLVTREANKGAFLIARSVTKHLRMQSYVAQGSPSWLKELLAEEGTRF